ncbi:MAG: selenium-dependent molybdenum cofactor biosynthesis protein YqeB [Anaerolineae bacterium]
MRRRDVVVVKGGGDLATGVAHRLHRAGFRVVITELAQPRVIRRTVAFASAIYEGQVTVEGVVARQASLGEVVGLLQEGVIPVLIDPAAEAVKVLRPLAVVDAIMAKRNTGTRMSDAPIVVGLGPGFTAGLDVHAVVETQRGHDLGRVILKGSAAPDTGVPGAVGGVTTERVLRAPCDGTFRSQRAIGQRVEQGDVVADVDGVPVVARVGGVLRGLLADGLTVREGMKIGDVDPRGVVEHCFTISDKARAVGGGVLEAILYLRRHIEET